MNLVFLQRLDQAGGGSRASLLGTLRALRDERPEWELTLVTQEPGPLSREVLDWGVSHRIAPLPRFRKPWERPAFLRECRLLAEALAGRQPDGILSNEWVTAPHALEVARHLRVPALSYVRDFAAVKRGRKYLLHRMDRLLCVCESMRQALIGAGYAPAKIHTVYNPIVRPAAGEPEDDVHARLLGMPPMERWLLYLGRISPRKNQIAAVKTLKLLHERTGQRWGLMLAGDADETYAAEVDQAVAAAGLAAEVIRLGLIANPGWLFKLADASILTSSSEGLARVLIESFLCGKPAFSYPLDGLEDVYGDDARTFVAAQRKPADLAARILAALANGGDLQERTAKLKIMLEARHAIHHHVAAFAQALRFGGSTDQANP
jgi:glycosyltransferase involved in cell wall biosynthesis